MEPKLSQEMIIKSAFAILAETQELSKLSMRNLAQKVQVKAPALYWYFKNKQDLLQKMAEFMENELIIPEPRLPWQERLVQFMENYYDLYTHFPCGAELEINTVPSYASRLEHLEMMIQILIQAGFSIDRSRQAVFALHNLLIGQLMDAILSMKSYVEENALVGLKASITAHQNQENEKQLFLDSVTIYLQGLAVQKES